MWRSLTFVLFLCIAVTSAIQDQPPIWKFPRTPAVEPVCQVRSNTRCKVQYDNDVNHVLKGICRDTCTRTSIVVNDFRENPPDGQQCPNGKGCVCCSRINKIRIADPPVPCSQFCNDNCSAIHGKCQRQCDPITQQESQNTKCPMDCVCCKPKSERKIKNVVSVKADPFFYSFDGKNFKYDGRDGCVYVLFQECVHRPSFSVLIRHHFIEDAKKMVVYEVFVVLEDIRVNLIKQDIYVNGELRSVASPFNYGNITVERINREIIKVTLKSKFVLKWNGSGRVAPILDQSMFGKVCGLLGNGDSDPDNDMQIPIQDGTLKMVDIINEFGDGWLVPGSCKG